MSTATERIRLAWDFPSDDSTDITATSEAGNMVVENLFNHQPAIRWRSTSTSAQTISGKFTSTTRVSFLLMYAHNLTAGTVQLQLAEDSGFTSIVLDQTWGAATYPTGFGLCPFGLFPFGLGCGDPALTPFLLEFFDTVAALYWRVIITNTGNPAGYVELGRLAMGEWWSPERANCDWGYSLDRQHGGEIVTTRGGSVRSRRRPSYRRVSLSFSYLSKADEARLNALLFASRADRNVLFVAYPETADTSEYRRHIVLSFIEANDAFERISKNHRRMSLTLREAL